MPQFTFDQLNSKDIEYNTAAATGDGFLDTDLLMGSIGTNTHELSSIKVSFQQLVEKYIVSNYAKVHGFTLTGNLSAQGGLSANGGSARITLGDLPTVATGLQTGDLYTQTQAQIHGSGSSSVKLLCVA